MDSVNPGDTNGFIIKESAMTVVRMTDTKSEIVCIPLSHDDPQQGPSEIRQMKRDLN